MMRENDEIIGREHEQDELLQRFARAGKGEGGIIVLSGEAGVGKTRLAEACLARSKIKIYAGKAVDTATPPYAPIIAIIRDYLRQSGPEPLLRDPLSDHLALLVPELGTPATDSDQETQFEAIASAVSTMAADSPCAIFLDDLQWADQTTLELLPFLANRVQAQPVIILATYRSDEIPRGHRLRWVRHELRRSRQWHEIALESLKMEDCAVLIARVLGEEPTQSLVRTIYEQTQGIPLFVEELSSTLTASDLLRQTEEGMTLKQGNVVPIPESVRDAVLLRLDGLSEASRRTLEVAAVAGTEFDLELLVEVAESEVGLDPLFEKNLLVESPAGRGRFRHALTREAILSEITWSRRRSLNRKMAAYLESSGVSEELISEYWLAARENEKARKSLLQLAQKSCQLHAYGDAAQAAFRALEIWPDGEDEELRLSTLEQLAHCAQLSGQLSDAVKVWREVVESPRIQKHPQRLGLAWRALATVHALQGAWEKSLTARITAAETFEKSNLPEEAALDWLATAGRHTATLNCSAALELCDKSLDLAKQAGRIDIQARALGLRGNVLAMAGKDEQGIDLVKSALSLALEHNLSEAASEVYRRLGSALEYASDFTGSREAYFTAFDYCQSQGVDTQAQLCLSCMSYVLFRMGDWKRCLEICKDVVENKASPEGSKHVALGVIGLIRAYRGETRPARKLLQEAQTFSQQHKVTAMELICHWGLAMLHEIEGEDSFAENHYSQLLELREKVHDVHDALPALCSAATFFGVRRMGKETALCAETLASIVSVTGNREALASLAYALGETALLNDNPGEATEQFRQALDHFEKLDVPVEQAKTGYRAGVAYAHNSDAETAIRHLRHAYRSARKLGARPLASKISEKLKALGTTKEERRSESAQERASYGGLTSRQMEILRLISDGLTNKEIAGQLFLSPRTVDMHVSHILERLNCRNRMDAVRKGEELEIFNS